MTDYSRIDFTQLKLEPIDSLRADADAHGYLSVTLNGLSMAKRTANGWVITGCANGLSRREVDELWKRTEQVDEFIRQRSRRRITVLELAKELICNEQEIRIDLGYDVMIYRFNRDICAFQYHTGDGEWIPSKSMGRWVDTVKILD